MATLSNIPTTDRLGFDGRGGLISSADGAFSLVADDGATLGSLWNLHASANTISLRNGTNMQTLDIYGTYTDASNYERLRARFDATYDTFRIDAEENGTGELRSVMLAAPNQNSTQVTLSFNGNPVNSTALAVLRGSRTRLTDEGVSISNIPTVSGYSDGGNVAIGGRKRSTGSGASGSVVVFGGDHASASQSPGDVWLIPGKNTTDSVYGSIYVGHASGNKIGFYGATPITQAVLATGASNTVDDVITFLQTIGLCKQS